MIASKLILGLSAAAGGIVAGLSVFAWAQLVIVPAAKQETRAVVEAEAERRTFDAIHSVGSAAERARGLRRYCAGRGLVYVHETNQCRE